MSEDIITKKRRTFDWPALKKEFITGDYKSLSEFKREKNISVNLSKPFKGWIQEKKELGQKALEAAKEELIRQETESIIDVKARQARLAKFLQLKGEKTLETVEITGADDARKLVVTGMQEERKILGIEGGSKAQNLTQININPKTNIDKLLEGLDYEGILGLIAELKRERTRRTLPDDDAEGAVETTDGEVL